MLWVVEIQAASFEDDLTETPTHPLRGCLRRLAADDSSGICDLDGWAISQAIEAEDMRGAWSQALRQLFEAASESGLPLWPIVGVSVFDAEYASAMSRWF
jgi:hypothetical protein